MSSLPVQRQHTRKQRSGAIVSFAFMLNSYLIFLLFGINFFLYVGYGFTFLSLLLLVRDILKVKRREGEYSSNLTFTDIVRMAWKYLRVNKIFLIATVLGLILSTIVISQTVLLSASYEQNAFENFINKGVDTTGYRFSMYDDFSNSYATSWLSYLEGFDDILGTEGLVSESYKTTYLYTVAMKIGEEIDDQSNSIMQITQVKLAEYDREKYDFYSQFSSFNMNFNASQTILVLNSWVDPTQVFGNNSGEISLVMGNAFSPANETVEFQGVKIDAYFQISDEERDAYIKNNNWRGWEKFEPTILTTTEIIDTIVGKYKNFGANNPNGYLGIEQRIQSEVFLALPSLSELDIDTFLAKLNRLDQKIWDWVFQFTGGGESNAWVEWSSPLQQALQQYKNNVAGTNAILMFITTPLIALALFLIYFSLSLVEQRKQRLLAIMKMRGSSREQMRVILMEEVIITGLIAVILGMVLSVPWTALALQKAGFFSQAIDLGTVVIPSSWYWKLPLIGMILTLDMNLPNINKLISATIDDIESFEERKQPFWQRFYLDLILFGLSMVFWIGSRFITFENVGFFVIIMIQLSPIFFILFFVGAPLVTARYFSDIISRFSTIMWTVSGGIFALATRNMKKNKFSASRLVSFLLLGMMLSTVAVIVPGTFRIWNDSRIDYGLGADIVIENLDSSNSTVWNMLDIPEVASYSEVLKSSVYTKASNLNEISILGINSSNFAETAYWEDNFADKSLSDLVAQMKTNDSMLMQEDALEALNLKIGDEFFITLESQEKEGSATDVLSLTLADSFTYFPNLVTQIARSSSRDQDYSNFESAQIVMNITEAKLLVANNPKSMAYIRVQDDENTTNVAEKLSKLLSFNSSLVIKDRDSLKADFSNDPTAIIIYSSLSSMLVITIIASVIAVSYFSFITLAERKREIGVFRSMGMVRNQIFMLLLIEGMTLLLVSLLLGFAAGYFSSNNIFFFFQQIFGFGGVNPAPPIRLHIPWGTVGIFSGFMLGLTGLASMVPAQITASKQTGSILRAE